MHQLIFLILHIGCFGAVFSVNDVLDRAVACEGSYLTLNCTPGYALNVTSASYGRSNPHICPKNGNLPVYNTGCSSTIASLHVNNLCHGKSSCTINASNSAFGDPCVGTEKYLEVEFKCSRIDWLAINEGQVMDIVCPKGRFIHIVEADYGQTNGKLICFSTSTFHVVNHRCEGKRRCSISASNSEFGDPCLGINKRLRVLFVCDEGENYNSYEIQERKSSTISCPEGTSIRVYDALYGIAGSADDDRLGQPVCGNKRSLDIVSGRCQYSSICFLSSNNDVFGDPCPFVEKTLYVEYLCAHDSLSRAVACEGSDLNLQCTSGFAINVVSARYGRSHPYVCPKNGKLPVDPVGCSSPTSISRVKYSCQGKSSCTVNALNNVFGDPCFGTEKYLEIKYNCTDLDWLATREGQVMNIVCPKGKLIRIIEADYGQTQNNLNCFSKSTFYIVYQRCEGKRRCSIHSSNSEFGDPCVGIIKRLRVKFDCAQGENFRTHQIQESNSSTISCPQGTSIRVYDVLYGIAGSADDDRLGQPICGNKRSLDIVSGRCQYSSICFLSSNNYLFGDPCPNVKKTLYVEYLCTPDVVNHGHACEPSDLNLECPSGYAINVVSARYGRSHPYVCPKNGKLPVDPIGCSSTTAMSHVKDSCQDKRNCTVSASNTVFGDPCIGTEKYLEVKYDCIG